MKIEIQSLFLPSSENNEKYVKNFMKKLSDFINAKWKINATWNSRKIHFLFPVKDKVKFLQTVLRWRNCSKCVNNTMLWIQMGWTWWCYEKSWTCQTIWMKMRTTNLFGESHVTPQKIPVTLDEQLDNNILTFSKNGITWINSF